MPPPVVGEWIETWKATATDTTVWVLAADGDDATLRIHVQGDTAGSPVQYARAHYGKWHAESGATDPWIGTLCFARRPGREGDSCAPFAIDTVVVAGASRRRLVVRGYHEATHPGGLVLLERIRSRE